MIQGLMDPSDAFSSSTAAAFPPTSTSASSGFASPFTSTAGNTISHTSYKTFPTGGQFASTAEGSTIRPYFVYNCNLQDATSMTMSVRNSQRATSGMGKRPRSPESPGDRPSKRPSLAAHIQQRSIAGAGAGFRHLSAGASSTNSSRHPSEDWVQQAGGLSIDSPNFVAPGVFPSATSQAGDFDMDMAVEEEQDASSVNIGMGMTEGPVSQLAPLQTNGFVQSVQQHIQEPATPHRHHYGTRYAERLQASLGPPQINVVPATPVNAPLHQTQQQNAAQAPGQPEIHAGQSGPDPFRVGSETRPSTPPPSDSSPTPMAISPTISFAQISSASMSMSMSPATPTAAKRRVMFGPRTGCEKCRMGIKHFTHYE
ncbi:unnamed protein product [Cyclocybe aegerita]|uniref:Uncharacterized protein n=1 Tax=Cyclocybe aegerita TaxID=1973307 RepID=A0A8S0X2U3_CYCAE|nr:unnamed protein product [Cyclocybe aegerita]